jgi:drug/metabolite transporter (DMT)-like permease
MEAQHSVEKTDKKVSAKILVAYLLCASIWGTTWYAIRVCIAPGAFPVFPAAALRFTISAFILAVIWIAMLTKLKKPTANEVRWILLSGALSGVAYGLLYAAEEHITGGIAAVISATGPLIAAIIAAITRTESLSRITVIGCVVAVFGIALVFHDRLQVSPEQASSVALLIVVCVCNACSNVVMKRHAHDVSALACNTIYFSAASIMLWLATALTGRGINTTWAPAPTIALLYLTIFGTLIAFASFFYLLKHVRLSTAMTLAFVTPLIALGVDALYEKSSHLTTESYAGIAIVLIGVAISVLLKDRLQQT